MQRAGDVSRATGRVCVGFVLKWHDGEYATTESPQYGGYSARRRAAWRFASRSAANDVASKWAKSGFRAPSVVALVRAASDFDKHVVIDPGGLYFVQSVTGANYWSHDVDDAFRFNDEASARRATRDVTHPSGDPLRFVKIGDIRASRPVPSVGGLVLSRDVMALVAHVDEHDESFLHADDAGKIAYLATLVERANRTRAGALGEIAGAVRTFGKGWDLFVAACKQAINY